MPVWVQLRRIPLQYFHPKGISYLASAIGKPLYMDRATALCSRLDYAKVCVEVDVEKEIQNVLNVDLGNECKLEVLVDTPWLPEKCARCKVFGHNCSSTPETAPPEVTEGSMAPADGSTAAKDPTIFKANILGGPRMATSSRSDAVKVVGNAELVTSVQLAAKKNTDNAINNSEELTSNTATGCPVEEKDAGAARNDLNKGKNKVSSQGDFPQIDNKPIGIELVGGRGNETNSDDELEVMESRVKDSRQLRSTSMEVAKLVKRVQGKRKSRVGKEVKEIDEVKVVGREMAIDQSMRDFTDFIASSELKDHPFTGCYFMWCNKRQERFQVRKIDRAMVKNTWFQRDIASSVEFLPPVADLQTQLAQVQTSILESDCMATDLLKKELDLRVDLSEVIDKEEKLLKQKSRVAWLNAGDQNTAFFHRAVKERNARSSIRVLYSNFDAKLEGIQEIKAEAVTFFQELLGRKDDRVVGISAAQLSHILKRKVSHAHYQSLLSPITEEEIKTALFLMGNDKSPGPNGFTYFLLNSLEAMGFPLDFLRWIKGCITSPYFSVAINVTLASYFVGKRGLRQGDPLSPDLFVIAMEVFSNLLDSAAEEGRVRFHPRCKSIKLTQLCFADDMFLFTNGSKESLIAIMDVLNTFYNWFGLKLNPQKSEIFTGGLREEGISELVNCSGFKRGALPVRYLGLPLVSGKLSSKSCEAPTERIVKRLRSWSTKYLSYASRVQLIRSVLFGMASYWCSHFILPKKVIMLEQQKCRSFLWKGLEQHTGGGNLRTLLSPYIRYRVSPGTGVSFWYDTWLPIGPLINYCTKELQCFPSLKEHATVNMILDEGHYVPQLAKRVYDYNKGQSCPILNLKGFIVPPCVAKVGNAVRQHGYGVVLGEPLHDLGCHLQMHPQEL
ncbi:hypothetical protein CRG98_038954 [Punica granatum]|uniref:Reverse transcriptase domain-containing protein n=1 Tax=Punica granatum TaxID=22663 RepID=A0A2I0I9M7_PUNGR|nr:hypothetical protein CRG98_038954 [Punica granatum]